MVNTFKFLNYPLFGCLFQLGEKGNPSESEKNEKNIE